MKSTKKRQSFVLVLLQQASVKKKQQKEACISNIEALLEPKHKETARVLKDSIDAIQDSKIKKITINTYSNYTARMSKTKDGIKVELEKKQKAETLA